MRHAEQFSLACARVTHAYAQLHSAVDARKLAVLAELARHRADKDAELGAQHDALVAASACFESGERRLRAVASEADVVALVGVPEVQ